ncbi:MAG: hypothetical protein WCI47_01565 [bacterium]
MPPTGMTPPIESKTPGAALAAMAEGQAAADAAVAAQSTEPASAGTGFLANVDKGVLDNHPVAGTAFTEHDPGAAAIISGEPPIQAAQPTPAEAPPAIPQSTPSAPATTAPFAQEPTPTAIPPMPGPMPSPNPEAPAPAQPPMPGALPPYTERPTTGPEQISGQPLPNKIETILHNPELSKEVIDMVAGNIDLRFSVIAELSKLDQPNPAQKTLLTQLLQASNELAA